MPTNSFERGIVSKKEKELDQENSQLLQQLRSMLVDWFNYTQSSGYLSGGTISDDGDGTITVAAGSGIIKTTDSPIGTTEFFTWSANTSLVMVDNGVNYIYVDYSAGTPVSKTTTDRTSIEQNRMFTLGRVYRSGTDIHIVQSGVLLYNFLRREHERSLELHGFERVSGGVVTETGTRNLATTVGSFYLGLNTIATSAQDTSGTDKFTYWYRDGGAGWTKVVDQTQIDNTQYDDGDGTLGTLTANRYGVHWVYIHFDNDIHVVYGQGDYTLANAEKASLPTDVPDAVSAFAILAAKIIIQKSAASFNSIVSAYVVTLHSVFTNADAVAAVETAGLDFVDAATMIGSANSEYVVCKYNEHSSTSRVIRNFGGYITNVNATDPIIYFVLDLPTNRGGKKLYIDGVKLAVLDADIDNFVSAIDLYGFTYAGGVVVIDANPTDYTVPQEVVDGYGTVYDVSAYDYVGVKVSLWVDTGGACDIGNPLLDCYYDD